jgi:hypothetical protein
MGYLKCSECGREVYSPNYRDIGLKCGVGNCQGVMMFKNPAVGKVVVQGGSRIDLQCKNCGSVFSSSAGYSVMGKCKVCGGVLDRYGR